MNLTLTLFMKKIKTLFSALSIVALTFVSCTKVEEATTISATETDHIEVSAAIDAANEMDFKTALEVNYDNANPSTGKSSSKASGNCAVVTVVKPQTGTFPIVFNVDFGTGCTTENQTKRKGKLKITITGILTEKGSSLKIERDNYYINENKIEGTVDYLNETTNQEIPQWKRTVTKGKLTTIKGDVFTDNGSFTLKHTVGFGTYTITDDAFEISQGTHTVVKENDGTKLTLTIIEPLMKKNSCEYISKGKLKLENNAFSGVVDYGNNDCDNLASFTLENGTVFPIKL